MDSHWTAGIFAEEFKFEYVGENIHNDIAKQNIVLIFLSKWHFVWQSKYGKFF